ncbi:hypothetical protein Purlil1_9251 [Purpureocillium lilacinum]|uniref:Rhodopsin domain-containing protein n=1 Tax=Purpureocillium lilacinum TaxID=33203 RepID=A0ABR0BQV6_PURLI|nr:hypothetical protein Purlil1_9251 [Purpureocillium lilacinum]
MGSSTTGVGLSGGTWPFVNTGSELMMQRSLRVGDLTLRASDFSQLPECAVSPLRYGELWLVVKHDLHMRRRADQIRGGIVHHGQLHPASGYPIITETACETPVRDRRLKFNVLNIILGAFTTLFVVTRLIYKQFFSASQRLRRDDWTIAATLVVGVAGIAIMMFGLTAHGMGQDVWGVSPSDVRTFAIYFYVMEMLYVVLIGLVKLTLNFFYLDIFPGSTMRRILWGTAVFQIAFIVAFLLKVVFQCHPTQYYWEQYDFGRTVEGGCININASAWANAAISVATDFWLLVIPLSQLRKLKLHWKKKVGATLMFFTGTIVTIVSILRLRSITHFARGSNPTWELWDIVWWSTIEVNVGIICTCLPALRLVLVYLFPRIFGTDMRSSRDPGSRSTANRQPAIRPEVNTDEELGVTEGLDEFASTTRLHKLDIPAQAAQPGNTWYEESVGEGQRRYLKVNEWPVPPGGRGFGDMK